MFFAKFMTQELEHNHISTRLKKKQMANSYVYKYTPSFFNSLKKHKILQQLKFDKNIVITNSDKGDGVVILNRHECIKSVTKPICDKQKNRCLSDCNWIRIHNHLVRKRTLNHLAKLAK